MIKASLLFNPHSGRVKAVGLDAERLLRMLSSHGIEAGELCPVSVDGVSDAVASLDTASLCIIAGGDGTIYEALQNHACLDLRFGILPLGTANNLARASGIPWDMHAAMDCIVRGRERLIDLGRAGDRVFTQAAGAGFHAKAFHEYGHRIDKSIADTARAFTATLSEWEPVPMRIIIDGLTLIEDALQVTVANTPLYGRKILIAPDAKIDDGLLDVVIVTGCTSKMEMIGCIIRLMEGRSLHPSNVTRVPAKQVDISPIGDQEIPVHSDAEPIGYAPVSIEVLPSCLRLMVPV